MKFSVSKIAFITAISFLTAGFSHVEKLVDHSGLFQPDTIDRQSFKWETQGDMRGRENIFFPASYTIEGVSTFRGGPRRDRPAYGTIRSKPKSLVIKWAVSTGTDRKWGGGAGWTGQPCIIKWSDSLKAIMNLYPQFKGKPDFKEVIIGGLDGKIYFLDLDSGKPSRPAIDIRNPIKGTVSVDPFGRPLLYAGQGISNTGEFGVRIFSLINQRKIFFLNGHDPFAYRPWSAFDCSPLAVKDYLFEAGENGLIYSLELNSINSLVSEPINSAWIQKYRYKNHGTHYQGVENSIAAYKDLIYFCDNSGYIQCLSAKTFQPQWFAYNHDDTDATLVIEEEKGVPFLYTGNEVDLQGMRGTVFVKKLNGFTGLTVWESKFPCLTVKGDHPVNGGMLSTPVIGKRRSSNIAVFSLSRYNKEVDKGLLVALEKSSGKIIWQTSLSHYAWSSPLDIYDSEGNMYIFLADSGGNIMLFDGASGEQIYKEKISYLFEASPASYDNKIIIASRPKDIFCLEIQ